MKQQDVGFSTFTFACAPLLGLAAASAHEPNSQGKDLEIWDLTPSRFLFLRGDFPPDKEKSPDSSPRERCVDSYYLDLP